MRRLKIERKPSPFRVGDRVRLVAGPIGRMKPTNGVVIAVRDEWPMVGNAAWQAVEVEYDVNQFSPDAIGYRGGKGAIRPWCAFEAEA